MGIGHPLIDALLDYYRSEAVSGNVLSVTNEHIPESTAARYIFSVDFSDGTKRELYKNFVLSGGATDGDAKLLASAFWTEQSSSHAMTDIRERLLMLTKNYEATIRSEYEGVQNVRANCIGLLWVN